jgi:hypothetical protein
MSRITRSHQRRPLVVTGLLLIGLAASAATTQAQRPSPGAALRNEPALLSHGPFRPAGEIGRERGHSSALERDRTSDRTSAYFAAFTGIGAEGRDMIWRGAVAGAAVGELTIRLAHVGRDVDTAKPTWPVEGIIFVSGKDPRRAFAAEVHGTIDWPTQRVKLAGEVSAGYMRGARIEQTAELIDHDLSGELRLGPAVLTAAQ